MRAQGCYGIGAIIVKGNKIISRGNDGGKIDHDPTCRAEIIAIRAVANRETTLFSRPVRASRSGLSKSTGLLSIQAVKLNKFNEREKTSYC